MGPAAAIKTGILSSFDFTGRSSRSEYLWFWVFTNTAYALLVWSLFALLAPPAATASFFAVTTMVTIPLMAAGVRRLHDAGVRRSLMLLPLVPLVRAVIFAVCYVVVGLAFPILFVPFLGGWWNIFFVFVGLPVLSIIALIVAISTLICVSHLWENLIQPSHAESEGRDT